MRILSLPVAAGLILAAFTPPATAREPVEARRPATFISEPLELATATGVLRGTLDLPASAGPWPVVLVIAGSGPTDRDGNQSRTLLFNDSLKQLGRGLAERGIAALRFDRRGVGESAAAGPEESEFRLGMLVDDAAAWIRLLREDRRFSKVTVAGHSEGSLVGMLAARQVGSDAFVSLAGPGRPFVEVLREQLQRNLAGDLESRAMEILNSLARGETVDSIPSELSALFRPSVQPYLISVFRHDPAGELKELPVPVLVIRGTTDLQVSVADAERLAAANSRAELRVFDGVNHVLKPAEGELEQALAYRLPVPAVAPEVINAVATFVKGRSVERESGSGTVREDGSEARFR